MREKVVSNSWFRFWERAKAIEEMSRGCEDKQWKLYETYNELHVLPNKLRHHLRLLLCYLWFIRPTERVHWLTLWWVSVQSCWPWYENSPTHYSPHEIWFWTWDPVVFSSFRLCPCSWWRKSLQVVQVFILVSSAVCDGWDVLNCLLNAFVNNRQYIGSSRINVFFPYVCYYLQCCFGP